MQFSEQQTKDPYDEEPVYYCKRCLSLNIRQLQGVANMDYCEDCGAVGSGTADIEEWEKMYEQKYGTPFLKKEEKKGLRY